MSRQETFVTRMRRFRERSRISLEEVAQITRIREDLLEAFERADLSSWPRGLYARAWVRAYAEAIGLDAHDAVEEFCRLFPEGDRRAHGSMVQLAAILDVHSRFRDDQALQSQFYGRRATDRLVPAPPLSLKDRLSRAAQIVRNVQNMRDLPVRLAESWRTLRPSRRAW
jgi:hypothetical protein